MGLNKKLYKGKLLISEPCINNFFFNKSVILLVNHNDKGSFGLIINKPTNVKLNKIIENFPGFDAKVYIGGPVSTNNLFILHTLGDKIENSFEIIDGLYWGGNIKTIKNMISNKQINSDEIHFYIGYSVWIEKQLDGEIKKKFWIITDSSLEQIFNDNPTELWNNILKALGKDYAIWANAPDNPILN